MKKSIDDLHKELINDLMKKSREEVKFNYVMRDIFEIMRELGWSGEDNFEVQVAGTLAKDKFIVIKNTSLNPRPNKLELPEGTQKPLDLK